MAGSKIVSSGGLQYADAPISSGLTRSLLSVFTDVSSAVPSTGDIMQIYNPSSPNRNYGYTVVGGTYASTYFINKNDPQGAQIWTNMATGFFQISDFYNYQHWTPDNYLAIDANVNPPDIFNFEVYCNSNTVFSDTMTNPNYSLGNTPMASAPGSSGAFDVGAINTDWTTSFTIFLRSPSMPSYNVFFDVIDLYTGDALYSNIFTLDSSNGFTFSDTFVTRYRYVMYFLLNIS